MAVIIREDGLHFVIRAYREVLSIRKKSLMVRDVKQLSEQNGQFLKLFKKDEQNLEVVFSKEPGFLLGETVRQYFGQPENLIVCEELPDKKILLVLIKEGSVYFDIVISPERLQSELTPIIASQTKYKVFVYGNTPLTDQPIEGKFQVPDQLVEIFQQFDEPLLDKLPALTEFQLLPLPMALKSDYLKGVPQALYFSLGAIVLIVLGWWIFHTPEQPNVQYVGNRVVKRIPPYQAYYQGLKAPYSVDQMTELARILGELAIAPGWSLSQLNFSGGSYTAHFISQGGGLEALETWATKQGFILSTEEGNATIVIPSKLSPRPKPNKIYLLNKMIPFLVDDLNTFLESKHGVSVGRRKTQGRASSIVLKLNLSSASPEFLVVLAEEINDLPVVISSVDLRMNNELLNGTMTMTVWGGSP